MSNESKNKPDPEGNRVNQHDGSKKTEDGHKSGNARPISLHPLGVDDALRAALQVNPEDLKRREQAEKKASKSKSAKRKK